MAVPGTAWPVTPSADDPATRHGAFIERIDRFDSRFFRISPIEARGMDPKQRMLIETAWHALEDAGMDPDRLRGSRTGVYMGVGGSEYRRLVTARGMDDSYAGTSGSIAVGRIAFALGLEGPAVPVDLACTSSLVAVHQALAGLQRGEADLALAGGVNTGPLPRRHEVPRGDRTHVDQRAVLGVRCLRRWLREGRRLWSRRSEAASRTPRRTATGSGA